MRASQSALLKHTTWFRQPQQLLTVKEGQDNSTQGHYSLETKGAETLQGIRKHMEDVCQGTTDEKPRF